MGRGIAQIAAQAGIRVLMFDALHGAAAKRTRHRQRHAGKLAEKGKISAEALAAACAKLEVVARTRRPGLGQVIIEAIVENIDVKKSLFQQLEDIIGADCILATNTSSLSVTSIAAACKRPERVGGFHFFNPVPLMKIVEVIDGLLTAPWVSEALLALGRRMGHTAVRRQGHAGLHRQPRRPRLRHRGAARPGRRRCRLSAIDRIMREAPASAWAPSSCSTSPASMSRIR
jgi:3-hydroxybutyryl-CoA dehydrogenase